MSFGVIYNDIEYRINCDESMAGFSPDIHGECTTDIMRCRNCVIDYIRNKVNKGWDNEANMEYSLGIRIGGEHIADMWGMRYAC